MTSGESGKVRQGESCPRVLAGKPVAAFQPQQTFTVWAQVWQALNILTAGEGNRGQEGKRKQNHITCPGRAGTPISVGS